MVLGTYSKTQRQWLFTEELREPCEIQPLEWIEFLTGYGRLLGDGVSTW